MGRAKTKTDLIINATKNFEKLDGLIKSMSEKELNTEFDFSEDIKKKEAHWGRDKNLRDILVHLYEWHQLVLNWVTSNMKGEIKKFFPSPYNWRTYGDLNVDFWEKHQTTSLEEAKEMLNKSHEEIVELAESFSDRELFTKNIFTWVGGSTLGSYFVSATASHYDWAMKKIRLHKKRC